MNLDIEDISETWDIESVLFECIMINYKKWT